MSFNILIVDDEADNLRVLSSLLKDSYNVLVAKTGVQAITIVEKQHVDLILLDIVMPNMDGFEVIEQLKSQPDNQNIPVIFITGLESSEDETHGFELGAVDYIHKPFNSSVVLARVSSQLKIIQQRNDLQQLSKKLQKASEAKGMFLANMSHEIRTPLTTIIGYAESMLSNDIAKNDWARAINIIDNSGKHLLALVNNILDFSKIEAGELTVESIETEFNKLLQQVHIICNQQANNKGLSLKWDLSSDLPKNINTDPTLLKQILINLISNAVKFTESGSVNVRIEINNDQLYFAIQDSGIGIPQDKLNDLFNSFTQVDNSTSRKYGGTGLGLSISHRLANKLGGTINVSSEVGVGSTFTVNVDLVSSAPQDTFTELSLEPVQVETDSAIEKFEGKVLIAEDHPENRQLFYLTLTSMGLEVDTVDNGEKAVQACISEDYTLVLMDIQMPIMNGTEAQKLIRSCGLDMPIIALTANVMKEEVESYIGAGFNDHLAKPLDKEQLRAKLQKYCNADSSNATDASIPQHLLDDLRDKFQHSFQEYAQGLSDASINKDVRAIAILAHKFQGAAKSFGFDEEAEVAELLEHYIQDARKKITDTTDKLIDLLDKEKTTISGE